MTERGNTTHRPRTRRAARARGAEHRPGARQQRPRRGVPAVRAGPRRHRRPGDRRRVPGYDGELEGELQDDTTDVLPEDDADRADPLPTGGGDGADATVYRTETREGSTDGSDAE
ncbi:hypothetical protein Q9Q99_15470 [Curtobacterium flaccumfaciens]|nr:hypothetical protein Q9Q99_15470 [Curtobacterium flaccumfaciens]